MLIGQMIVMNDKQMHVRHAYNKESVSWWAVWVEEIIYSLAYLPVPLFTNWDGEMRSSLTTMTVLHWLHNLAMWGELNYTYRYGRD